MKKLSLLFLTLSITLVLFSACTINQENKHIYYVNNISVDDSSDGRSTKTAWKALDRASQVEYAECDQLLLCPGCTLNGKLELTANETKVNPVIVSSYKLEGGKSELPIIDAKGYDVAVVSIKNGKHIQIRNLKLTSDAGTPVDSDAKTVR